VSEARRAPRLQVVSPTYPSTKTPYYGTFVRNMNESLRARGFEVGLRATIPGGGSPAEKLLRHLRLGLGLSSLLVAECDLLVVHAPTWFALPSLLVSRRLDLPLVLHLHGSETMPHRVVESLFRPLLPRVACRAACVVVPSEYFGALVVEELGVDAQNVFVSPSGGVDANFFFPRSREEARRHLDLPAKGPLVGFVGRLVANKNWRLFLDVVARLRENRPDVRALVVGSGGDEHSFTARLEELELLDSVHRLPSLPQSELAMAYSAMDVLVFPSDQHESLGLVPLEALACGVPVVARRLFAIPEFVVPGENGHLCGSSDAGEFAQGVLGLLAEGGPDRAQVAESVHRYRSEHVADGLAARLRTLVR